MRRVRIRSRRPVRGFSSRVLDAGGRRRAARDCVRLRWWQSRTAHTRQTSPCARVGAACGTRCARSCADAAGRPGTRGKSEAPSGPLPWLFRTLIRSSRLVTMSSVQWSCGQVGAARPTLIVRAVLIRLGSRGSLVGLATPGESYGVGRNPKLSESLWNWLSAPESKTCEFVVSASR